MEWRTVQGELARPPERFFATGALTGCHSRQGFESPLRRIKFKDRESGKTFICLTNHLASPALAITKLYRLRWRIDLFFKWIKQHLRI